MMGIACQVIGKEGDSDSQPWDGMERFLPLLKLECYLIWMRGHCQYTTMEESWV